MRHSHAAVLDEVRRALRQREGLIVVTGATGTGTTSLCRTLVQELEPGACASIVLDPRVTLDDLLLHVLTDFGVISSGQQIALNGAPTRDQLVRALQHFLASLIPMWGCAVLVIDEAQDVDPEVLRQLRLLLNFETDGAKLLQIVLVGQPELNHVLRHPSLRQLDDCVARRCELEPPPLAEPVRYAEEFVSVPQPLERVPQVTVLEPDDIDRDLAGPVLTYPPPVSVVATRPRIVPQTIEVVCDRALDVVHERRLRRVDWRITRTVGNHPLLRALAPSRLRSSNKALAAAAVVLVGVVGLGVGSWSAGGAGLPAALPPPQFANTDSQLVLSKSIDVKALPGVDSFNVRVASFRASASATALKARLEAAGLPAFIRIERGGLHYVIVGPYLSHAETSGVQARLAAFGHSDTDVFVEYFEPPDAQAGTNDRGGLMARSPGLQR